MQSIAPPQQPPQQRDHTMEQHIQQTNERLQCIRQYLESPTTFANSAKELLDWCKDVRAFQRPFEQGLMGCLTVVHQVASQPGYDLNLAYRLMVVCSSHRDKLSPKSSSLLSSWFEELSHLQFLRQLPPTDTQSVPPPPPPGSAVPIHRLPGDPVTHMQDSQQRANTIVWQNTALRPQQQQQQQQQQQPQQHSVSIVTTVWEVTNGPGAPQTTVPGQVATPTTSVITSQMTAQLQQQQHQQRVSGATVRYPPGIGDNGQGQAMYGGGVTPSMPRPAVPGQQMHVTESQLAGLQSQQGGNAGFAQGPAPAAAAAAAAVAAAAATATATATAQATAQLQEQQERQQAQHGQGMAGPQPGYGQQQYYNQRQFNVQPTQQPVGYPPGFNRAPMPQQRALQYQPQQQMRQYPQPHNPAYARQQSSGYMYPDSSQGYLPSQGQVSGQTQGYGGNPQQGTAMTPDGMNGPGFPTDPNRPLPSSQLSAMQFVQTDRGMPPKLVNHRQFPSQYPPQDNMHQMNMQPGTYGQPVSAYPAPPPQSPHYGTGKPPPGFLIPQAGPPGHFSTSVPPQMTNQVTRRGSLPPYPGPGPGQAVPSGRVMNHESVAGTPTHPYPIPVTDPNGAVRVDLKPNPAMLGLTPDEKPGETGMKQTEATARLSFPVRDGIVLMPFRLQHNLSVSNHVFLLKEQVFKTLITRSDLELQFKCYHHEDGLHQTNWPTAVSVNVNAEPVPVERGDGRMAHKPLYIKKLCQVGKNTIQIAVTACCCSHLFVLQLVHRPSINSVLQSLLKKRLLGVELCIEKIRSNFSVPSLTSGQDGVEQTSIKVSLKCPLSFRRIAFPARGRECRHVQCFNLESYLQLNCERGTWKCPVCSKPVPLELIEVDQFIWGILTTVANSGASDVEEVMIDPNCQWKPVMGNVIKQEPDDDVLREKRKKMNDGSVMPMFRQGGGGSSGPGAMSGNGSFPGSGTPYNSIPVSQQQQQQQHGIRFPPDYNQTVSQYGEGPPRPAPPARYPPPYLHGSNTGQVAMQLQQQQQPYASLPPHSHQFPPGQSGMQYSSVSQSHAPLSTAKADGSGRNTPGTGFSMAGNNSGHSQSIVDAELQLQSTNPGTPQVEALERLTMCSDNPGSNAPRSNMSISGAQILSVQNFPADDQFDLDILGTLEEFGDLSDDNELLKLFDNAVN